MSEAELVQGATVPQPQPYSLWGLVKRKFIYIALLVLAIFGIAYTNLAQQPLNYFWEAMTGAMVLLCIVTGWPQAEDWDARFRLILRQALHWASILAAMYIVLLPTFQSLLPVPASSLVILMLLALGTFLAGANLLSVEICFLGLIMAVAVPAIAWLKGAALFLLLGTLAILGLVIAFWPRRSGKARAA